MKYQLNPLMEITAPELAIVSSIPGIVGGGTLGYLKNRKVSKKIKLLRQQIDFCSSKEEFHQFYKDHFWSLGAIGSKINEIVYRSTNNSWKENAIDYLDQFDKIYNKPISNAAKGALVGGLGTTTLGTLYAAKKFK